VRVHAFEFNERRECPAFVRDAIVETLGTGLRWGRIYDGAGQAFAEFCQRARCDAVLDLCSGSGEPVSILLDALARRGAPAPRFVLSDLFPNVAAMRRVAARHPGQVEVVTRPVDATCVPAEVDRGARCMISALHHFPPGLAARMLGDCVARRRAVFLLDAMSGDARSLLAVLPSMTAAVLATPLLAERDRLLKALATYALPVVPLAGLWDAVVSHLRSYGEADLRAMVAPLGGGYAWEYRELPFFPGGRAMCFYGVPGEA
jgi:hypothetical protein